MSGSLRFDEVGAWSELKLDIIREYSKIYATVLSSSSTSFKYSYIDGFAGAGKHISKTTGETIEGSPWIAVNTDPPFDSIHLIDLDSHRVENLRSEFESDTRVTVYEGNCNDHLKRIIPTIQYSRFERAFCLLDPYGVNLEWEVMELAGNQKTIDLILNFPVADMNRNMLWKEPTGVSDDDLARMTAFWGNESWRKIVYKNRPNLFDDDEWFVKDVTNEQVAKAFCNRLSSCFSYVQEPIPMKNSKKAIVYYLIMASNNPRASAIQSSFSRKHRGK